MPPELVRRVLQSASPDEVLIGGQALAYWMGVYDVHLPAGAGPAVSRDVAFFTRDPANSASLKQFAHAIGGRAQLNDIRNLPALVGSAVAPAGNGRVYNVDLLHKVVGLGRDQVQSNAVAVQLPHTDAVLRVMHPLDVLHSRNANLHLLTEKQDDAGRLQLQLAIEVARRYLDEQIEAITRDTALTDRQRERGISDAISAVVDYCTQDAARKNASHYGIHLADAIPAWRIRSRAFWEKQWPHLRARMSAACAAQCEQRAGRRP